MRAGAHTLRKNRPWAGLTSIFPSMRTKTRGDVQILRKLWHVGMMLAIALTYAYLITDRKIALLIIGVLGGGEVILDLLRLRISKLNRFITFLFGPLMRKHELRSMSSMGYFFIALFLVVAIFPKPVAILAILCLGFGDPAACIIGIKFGRDMLMKGKSLQGSIACFAVSSVVVFIILALYGIGYEYLFFISIAGGLAATFGELFASKLLDDNLTVPLATASVVYPLLLLFTDF